MYGAFSNKVGGLLTEIHRTIYSDSRLIPRSRPSSVDESSIGSTRQGRLFRCSGGASVVVMMYWKGGSPVVLPANS